jgi:hypothetical protein
VSVKVGVKFRNSFVIGTSNGFLDKPTIQVRILSWLQKIKIMHNNLFAVKVTQVLDEIRDLLIAKNQKYGNSALEPLGVFSKLDSKEGLLVRIDDKLKRIKNGSLERDDEDVINDLIGYLVLLKISG